MIVVNGFMKLDSVVNIDILLPYLLSWTQTLLISYVTILIVLIVICKRIFATDQVNHCIL